MLKEIICDKFKQHKVVLHEGLNSVLGDDVGTNSIGKTTFLLIVDFVFGGQSLTKAKEVFKHTGHFAINYCFSFDGRNYFFSRNTDTPNIIWSCNENYEKQYEQNLTEYNLFLLAKYHINLPNVTFREIVSLFSRIYGKENNNEKKPLDLRNGEAGEKAISRLLKLFNLYSSIAEFDKTKIQNSERLKIYKSAQKMSFISQISHKQYKHNIKQIEELKTIAEQLELQLASGCISLETEQLEELSILKVRFSALKRSKNKYIATINRLKNNELSDFYITGSDLQALQIFFPEANVKKIELVNNFHVTINQILSDEISKQITHYNKIVTDIENEISSLFDQVKTLTKTENPSQLTITKLLSVRNEIERLSNENQSYDNLEAYKNDKKFSDNAYKNLIIETLARLQNLINSKMEQVNDYIYSNTKKSPLLIIDQKSYRFSTPDDTGTGTSYKNMIIFDLSALDLTVLPILIHDSIILKQVADEAIDKIMELYTSFDTKQIFIAIDKRESYLKKTQDILKDTTVLELSGGGNELFGWSWNKKE